MTIVDTDIVEWLERMHNLHTAVEATYVVDGYLVQLTYDGTPMLEFHATTLRGAYLAAMAYKCDESKRKFVPA